jgi:hypothetical protein
MGTPQPIGRFKPGNHIALQKLTSSDPRLNPSSKTFCQKCSERNNLSFAYANGKAIFLCERHYEEWFREVQRDKEMVREQPFKQQTTIDGGKGSVEQYHGKQGKKVW